LLPALLSLSLPLALPPSVTPTVVTGMCEYGKHEQRVRFGDVEIFEFRSEASDSNKRTQERFYSDQRAQRCAPRHWSLVGREYGHE